MLTQIIFLCSMSYFKATNIPNITSPHVDSFDKSKETKDYRGLNEDQNYTKNIAIVVNFQYSFFIDIFSITNKDVAKNLRILFVDTVKDNNNKPVVSEKAVFFQHDFDSKNLLQIICLNQIQTPSFVVLLQAENPRAENPLIKYLSNYSARAFKIRFVFEMPNFEKVLVSELIKVIKELETTIQPLKNILEKEIEYLSVSVLTFYEEILKLRKEWKNIERKTRYKVNNLTSCNISENLRAKIINYLDFLKDFLESKIIEGSSNHKIQEEKRENRTALMPYKQLRIKINKKINEHFIRQINKHYIGEEIKSYDLILEIKTFLKEKAWSVIVGLNTSEKHRDRLFKIFHVEIESYSDNRYNLLTVILQDLKENTTRVGRILTIETPVFKQDTETGKLVEVEEF
ncbi:hypothetical protein CDIK_1844 [Cucumispora dikerogammari]|nr:hypothetical protein CDIK_1844 [Cucumispora dikerogammari]